MLPGNTMNVFCFSLEVISLQGWSTQNHYSCQRWKVTGHQKEGIHHLLLQTWCPWSDVPLDFIQQPNVGSLVPALSLVRWRTCQVSLPICLIIPDSPGAVCLWNIEICVSFSISVFLFPLLESCDNVELQKMTGG